MTNTTIPCLPCESLDETLDFWRTLGFEVTYRQKAPNPYGVIERDGYALHFFGLKRLASHDNFSTCLVIVPDVEQLHATFAECLRSALGKVPARDFPRISRMKPGQTRFTVTDNAGNSVIFVKRGGEDGAAADAYKQSGQTPLQRAVNLAARLRDFKNDDAMAAKVLDDALARNPDADALDRVRALAARIELAVAMGDSERADDLRAELKQVPLSDDERQMLSAN
jgi:catechol 2,3-dioxygenase-like lactoylglutathione lyase family enzyme